MEVMNVTAAAGLLDRVDALTRDISAVGQAISKMQDQSQEDLRYLARVLGVTLPSEQPRPAVDYTEPGIGAAHISYNRIRT